MTHRGRLGQPVGLTIAATAVAAIMLLPIAYLFVRVVGAAEPVIELLSPARLAGLLLRTAGFAAAVTAGGLVVGVPLAWLTQRSDLPARRFWAVALAMPLVIPSYVGGYVFIAALGPRGMLQQTLAGPFGVERLPEIYGFGGATLVLVAFTYPYVYLTVRSALVHMDPGLEEAARGMGHGAWTTFWRVVFPQLRPSMTSGGLLVALYALGEFGAVALLRFDTFTRAIYVQYQASFDRTVAAALALVLVAVTLIVVGFDARATGRARFHRSTSGSPRPAASVPLGRWRLPALIFCGVVLGVSLILPFAVLIFWLVRGFDGGVRSGVLFQAVLGSVQASGLAAIAATVAALPVAILATRHRGQLAATLARLTYVGFALPGIVVALALVFFGANFASFLYQTLALLVVAYVIRFLPQALGATRASLLQVGPHLEEAARGLGRTPLQVWRMVTFPLVMPGLLSGSALVFLTAMKELPVTLLLSPIGFRTLATQTWSAAADGLFAEAAVPSLLLVLCSVPPLIALLGRRHVFASGPALRPRLPDVNPAD